MNRDPTGEIRETGPVPIQSHSEIANFIWSICNLLRGPYRRNEYRKVILPLTVLRRFDCLLAPTKAQVLAAFPSVQGKPETVVRHTLQNITGRPFYNLSKLNFGDLLADSNQIAPNFNSYINAFSPNVRGIMEKFAFDVQIARMNEKNLLFEVVQQFSKIDLSFSHLTPDKANIQMGYVFEELIRIGAEQSNEEAGEHFTPREVIKLMVNLLLAPETDLAQSHVVKTIYDPACGTGGMLSVAEDYIRRLNSDANPLLYGQDWNDEAWAVCKADMLIKGEEADNILQGDTFTKDGFADQKFDYMLANPPFGVEWKQQQKPIEDEHRLLGYGGRFGAGTPRVNDGALLFLQHMIAKMQSVEAGGSRIAIVFNGSPLFTGDAGSGESEIRRWIIENDWLEAIVALPDQLFYNTGISTYIWVLTNRKRAARIGKIQLIDARHYWVAMRKSLGNKRHKIGDADEGERGDIDTITGLYGEGKHDAERAVPVGNATKTLVVSKLFDNEAFGFQKIVVERPLRLSFAVTPERLARLETEPGFRSLAESKRAEGAARQTEIALGKARQKQINDLLDDFTDAHGETLFLDRKEFLKALKSCDETRGVRPSAAELKAVLNALGERDESAEICRDRAGAPEADAELRDTENVPLGEKIEAYFAREVLPHVPDAWIDASKTKIGYEIPFNRHFYRYEAPRPLEHIEADIKTIEREILELLAEVTA